MSTELTNEQLALLLKLVAKPKDETATPSREDFELQVSREVETMTQAEFEERRSKGWDPSVEANERYAAATKENADA